MPDHDYTVLHGCCCCLWLLALLLLPLLPLLLLSAGYQYDVSGLFGAAPPSHPSYDKDGTITGVPVDLFNRKLQVMGCCGGAGFRGLGCL